MSLLLLALPGCGEPSADFPFEEVRYGISGGIAGFDRSLRFAPGGSYQVTDAGRTVRNGRFSGAQLREMKRLLHEVDWTDLRPEYLDGKVVDSLHQFLSVRTEAAEHVTTVGTGGNPPPAVAALLAFLDAILRGSSAP